MNKFIIKGKLRIGKFVKDQKRFFGDIKHISWLFKNAVECFIKGDKDGVDECLALIDLHWNYMSQKIK
jgi:hypothetical protein